MTWPASAGGASAARAEGTSAALSSRHRPRRMKSEFTWVLSACFRGGPQGPGCPGRLAALCPSTFDFQPSTNQRPAEPEAPLHPLRLGVSSPTRLDDTSADVARSPLRPGTLQPRRRSPLLSAGVGRPSDHAVAAAGSSSGAINSRRRANSASRAARVAAAGSVPEALCCSSAQQSSPSWSAPMLRLAPLSA
jgi:hypothetical protein